MLGKESKIIVQGITGTQGRFHTKLMLEYGTRIVAGVTPGKGGEVVEGIPVYNTCKDALSDHIADFSIIFVPAKFTLSAVKEALQADLNVVCITEGVPVYDTLEMINLAKEKNKILIGPNCPGIIQIGECKLGIMPSHIFQRGNVSLVSRSGTLTYEIVHQLSLSGIGQRTVIGIGGDPLIGFDFLKALELFEKDPETKQIILIGEIGGDMEERAAEFVKSMTKPVFAYIAGISAPKGKKMGHAGAIIQGNKGTAESKIKAFEEAGVKVARLPSEIINFLKEVLSI